MYLSRPLSSGPRPPSFFRRQKTAELFSEDTSAPLLSGATDGGSEVIEDDEYRPPGKSRKMGFFDNITKWDRTKRYRYFVLLALSLSGDGW